MSEYGRSDTAGRILVVDDEAPVRRLLAKLLGGEGYEVIEAEDGDEGLSKLWALGADTVLLDLVMPGLDGIEVCRRIRAHPESARTPVVFLTATSDRALRRRGREVGADDFLIKPFDEIELLARVRNSVRLKLYYEGVERERSTLRAAVDNRTAELDEASGRFEKLQQELRFAQEDTLKRLARAAEFRDDETAAHLQRMSHYCYVLARRHGFDEVRSEMIRVASPMHDVGKIGIPDHILLKPGRLTPDEYQIMKQHAEIGYRILSGSESPLVHMAAIIAHSHHEKWDGTGYPQGQVGEAIPIEGRISAIADVFDALTSSRPYKRAWPLRDALALMRTGRGSHFDPHLLDLFLAGIDEFVEIRLRFQDEPEGHVVVALSK